MPQGASFSGLPSPMEALEPLSWVGLLGWGLLLGRSTVVGGYLEASQRLPGGTSEASRRLPRGYLSWGDPPSSEAKQPPNFRGDNLGGNLKATRTLLYGGLLSGKFSEEGGLRTLNYEGEWIWRSARGDLELTEMKWPPTLWGEVCRGRFINS